MTQSKQCKKRIGLYKKTNETSKQKKKKQKKKQHRLSRVRAERALCGTTRPTAADPTANGNDPRNGDLLLSRAQPVAVQVLCGLATRVGIIAGRGAYTEREGFFCVKIKRQKKCENSKRILRFFVLGTYTIHISSHGPSRRHIPVLWPGPALGAAERGAGARIVS
jgi:hypothetical protein